MSPRRATRGQAKTNRNMYILGDMAPDEATVGLLFDPLATTQLQDLRLGQARQRREVERVEVLLDRELGVLDPCGHRVGGASGQFQFGEVEQELGEGLVGCGSIPRQRLELPTHRRQAQLPEVGLEQLRYNISHCYLPFEPRDRRFTPSPTVGPGSDAWPPIKSRRH